MGYSCARWTSDISTWSRLFWICVKWRNALLLQDSWSICSYIYKRAISSACKNKCLPSIRELDSISLDFVIRPGISVHTPIYVHYISVYLCPQVKQRENHNHKPVFTNCSQYVAKVEEEHMPHTHVLTVQAEDRDAPEDGGNDFLFSSMLQCLRRIRFYDRCCDDYFCHGSFFPLSRRICRANGWCSVSMIFDDVSGLFRDVTVFFFHECAQTLCSSEGSTRERVLLNISILKMIIIKSGSNRLSRIY